MNMDLLYQSVPVLIVGAWVSLKIAFISCFMGISFGTLIGLLLTNKGSWVALVAEVVTGIIRGTPMLIQILIAFYVVPQLGIGMLSAFWTAALAIGINSAAYISVVVKTGITAVGKGQIEAGKVLGLTDMQIARYIVLPQALRIVLPALGNELITLIKDSSLASAIGVVELSRQGSIIRSRTYDAVTVYIGVCCFYLLMTGTVALCFAYIERKMHKNHAQH